MPEAPDLNSLTYWQGVLAEVEGEIKEMGGAPDFSMGPLTIDEQKSFERLQARKVECIQNLRRLGDTASGISYTTQAAGSY